MANSSEKIVSSTMESDKLTLKSLSFSRSHTLTSRSHNPSPLVADSPPSHLPSPICADRLLLSYCSAARLLLFASSATIIAAASAARPAIAAPLLGPVAITSYLSSTESLSGTNFRKWKEQISLILGIMDLDYDLWVDAPAALTTESSTEQKAAYEKWEHSNRISLMIMKGSITTAIQEVIPDLDNAKLYLAHIEEQFQGSSKAHDTTLITKMVTLKYSGSNSVREHILRMNDMAS
ncbi:hypothetical protein RJ639_047124 [Escallonia herrerae]|uniref:UBN2_3 domain-containing protein n=1 Tax=Escallonia herrerae TaxID=1293975 RepID=A0AA88W678_9ASTE|nr:hypothetical protein RJ639_047124 [Escallonia herrerae]